MLERIELKTKPDTNIIMEFITKASPREADNILCRYIDYEMRKKLASQRDKGFKGWNTAQIENTDLLKRLRKNLDNGDYLDVINLASMLLARENMFKEKYLGQ